MKYCIPRIHLLLLMLACSLLFVGRVDAAARGDPLVEEDTTTMRHSRQRRAMGGGGGNHRRRRYHNYPDGYSLQEEQEKKRKYYKRTHQAEASLSDVWLCYAFALLWASWFISSFLNTDLMRFAESDSVLVQ